MAKKWINSFEGDTLLHLGCILATGKMIQVTYIDSDGTVNFWKGMVEWFVVNIIEDSLWGVLAISCNGYPPFAPLAIPFGAVTDLEEVEG